MSIVKKVYFLLLFIGCSLVVLEADEENKVVEYPNGIAAIVEDQIITIDEIDRQILPALAQLQRECRTQEEFTKKFNEMRKNTLHRMINQILIVKDIYSRKGVKIPQSYLDAYYHAYIQENFQGDRSKFLDHLQLQGKSDREFREFQKEQLIVSNLMHHANRSQSEISPEKIQKFYSENSQHFIRDEAIFLHQITLAKKENETQEEMLQRAESILTEVKNGASFAELAKLHSVDDKRKDGGKWGWINRGEVHKELGDTLFSLPKGELGQPIAFNNYVFIPYIEDKREQGLQSIDEARQYIEKILAQELSNEVQSKMLQRLRKKAFIKYFI